MLLNIICTRNTAMSKRNTEAGFPVWFMDETTGRLIIYEDEPENFSGLRELLEDFDVSQYAKSVSGKSKRNKNSFLLM